MILAGKVRTAGGRIEKPGTLVPAEAPLEIAAPPHPFVSRGGVKLRHALDVFHLDPLRAGVPGRRGLHGRIHGLPAPGGGTPGDRRGRRLRATGRSAAEGSAGPPAGAHQHPIPGGFPAPGPARPRDDRCVLHLPGVGAAGRRPPPGSSSRDRGPGEAPVRGGQGPGGEAGGREGSGPASRGAHAPGARGRGAVAPRLGDRGLPAPGTHGEPGIPDASDGRRDPGGRVRPDPGALESAEVPATA